MNNQVLSIEQMRELKELGIDTSKVSMCWFIGVTPDLLPIYSPTEYVENKYIPTFTLQDILEILPKSILGSTKQIKTVEFKLTIRENKIFYMQNSFDQQWLKCIYGNTLLEAAFNMLKWCKQNNYI